MGPEVHADVVGKYFVCREKLTRPEPVRPQRQASEIKTEDYLLRLKVWNVCGSEPVCFDAVVGERSCVYLRADGTFWVEYGWLYVHVDDGARCHARKKTTTMKAEEQVATWVESKRIETGSEGCAFVVWVRPHQVNKTDAHRVFFVEGGKVFSRFKPEVGDPSNWHALSTSEKYDEVGDNGKYVPEQPKHICEGFLNSVRQKILMIGLPW